MEFGLLRFETGEPKKQSQRNGLVDDNKLGLPVEGLADTTGEHNRR